MEQGGGTRLQNGGIRPLYRFCRNILRDKDQGRVQDMGHRRTFEVKACRGVNVAYDATRVKGGFDERDTCLDTEAMTMSVCTACATWAAAGGAYGGDIPGIPR